MMLPTSAKWLFTAIVCLLCTTIYAQKRTAVFKVDVKGAPGHLKPADIHVHIRESIDRERFLKADGTLDEEKFTAATSGKLDTNIALSPEFSFRLRDLITGAAYSMSIYYWVPLNAVPAPEFRRFRSTYQSVKINSWAFEYTIAPPPFCAYDNTLNNPTCPKCRRSDSVLPVLYDGEEVETPAEITLPAPIKSHKALVPDNGCNPNWYCGRDKLSF